MKHFDIIEQNDQQMNCIAVGMYKIFSVETMSLLMCAVEAIVSPISKTDK